MRIAIIAPSITHSIDGVADYSIKLGRVLQEMGHTLLILGVNDYHQEAKTFVDESAGIRMKNLTIQESYSERAIEITKELAAFRPERMLTQYYWRGYWTGGKHSTLARLLRTCSPAARRTIMFHETWSEAATNTRMPHWLRSSIVAASIKLFHGIYGAEQTFTNTERYKRQLKKLLIRAEVLAVPSNINKTRYCKEEQSATWRFVSGVANQVPDLSNARVIAIFGRIPPGLNYENILKKLDEFASDNDKQKVLISIGKTSYHDEGWKELESCARKRNILAVKLGMQEAGMVSSLLAISEIGIVTTEIDLLDKSSSYAAMRDHGLTVIAPLSNEPNSKAGVHAIGPKTLIEKNPINEWQRLAQTNLGKKDNAVDLH